jgi:hypothetical protein
MEIDFSLKRKSSKPTVSVHNFYRKSNDVFWSQYLCLRTHDFSSRGEDENFQRYQILEANWPNQRTNEKPLRKTPDVISLWSMPRMGEEIGW